MEPLKKNSKIQRRGPVVLVIMDGVGFGKYKGRSVAEVFRLEPSYYAWMMNGDFPLYTKKVITEIRMRDKLKQG